MSDQRPSHDNSREPSENRFGLDAIILAVSAVAFCTSLYFLFQDNHSNKSPSAFVSIGEFSNARKDVRRRTRNGVNWQRIDSRDAVYDGDSIFTGRSSSVTLTLNDGSHLVVEEKSLVVIRTEAQNAELNLQYGSVTGRVASEAQPLVTYVNGTKNELHSSHGEFRLTHDGISRLTAKDSPSRPQQQLPIPPPITQVITATEQASTTPDLPPVPTATPKVPAVKRVELEPLSPQNDEQNWVTNAEPVVFQWRELFTDAPPHSTMIEFARDEGFKKPIGQSIVVGNEIRLPSDRRPSGTFYWRVRNVGGPDGDSLPTQPRKTSIHLNVPPDPQVPFDSQELTFNPETGEKSKQVVFAWEDRSISTEYEVQVAHDRNFESLILSRKVKRKTEYSPLLPKGTYYWRVAGLHPGRKNPPWSPIVRFVIEEELRTLGAPSLEQTSIRYQLSEKDIARTPASPQGDGRGFKPPKLQAFTWAPVERALGYEVEISTDPKFDTSLRLPIGKVTKYVPPEVRPGSLHFRVRAVGKNDLVSSPSQTGRLEIKLPAPKLDPIETHQASFLSKVEYDAGKHDFQLKWSPLPFAASYEIEFATATDFADAQKYTTTSSAKSVSVSSPSEYRARVRGLASNGTPVSDFSPIQVTKFEKALALPPPIPLAEKLPASVPDSAPSVVVLAESPSTPDPTPMPTPATSQLKPQDPIDPALSTPSLKEPSQNTQLISIGGAAVFINFKWSRQTGADSYEVQISTDQKFRSTVEKIETPKVDLLLQQKLPKGRVYWRVRAKSETGFSAWSEPNLILVQNR